MTKILSPVEVIRATLEHYCISKCCSGINNPESIAAGLRHAGQYLCPTTSQQIRNAVFETYDSLVHDTELKLKIEQILDWLIAYGDFIESEQVNDTGNLTKRSLLYASPLSFVKRDSGNVMLFGLVPDPKMVLPDNLRNRIEYNGYTRSLAPLNGEDISSILSTRCGLIAISTEVWLRAPRKQTASEYFTRIENMLKAAKDCGELHEISILVPSTPVAYYSGRWQKLTNQTGHFIGRRPQAFGAALWCFLQSKNGIPTRIIDLPIDIHEGRGCDSAWRLQSAIDTLQNRPQIIEVSKRILNDEVIVRFFSPLPMWCQKRLDLIGRPVLMKGCLFAYALPRKELNQEIDFLSNYMWLKPILKQE